MYMYMFMLSSEEKCDCSHLLATLWFDAVHPCVKQQVRMLFELKTVYHTG